MQVFLDFAHCYQQFIWGFNRIATPLISILRTTNNLAASKLIVASEGNILRICNINVIGKASIVGKANTASLAYRTRFFTPGARLAFA